MGSWQCHDRQQKNLFLLLWRGRVLVRKFMMMFKINMDARKSRPLILKYIPDEINLTAKLCAVHQISMTYMCPFRILLVNEVLTRSCFYHTLKIQIKYCSHLTTGFYGHSMLRECPVRNNTLSATKVLKLFFTWIFGGAKSASENLNATFFSMV